MDVCACDETLENTRLCLRNHSTDRIEIWYGGEVKVSLSSV